MQMVHTLPVVQLVELAVSSTAVHSSLSRFSQMHAAYQVLGKSVKILPMSSAFEPWPMRSLKSHGPELTLLKLEL